MHKTQKELLGLIGGEGLSGKSLREIAGMLDDTSAQQVKHHLTQLSKKGFIAYNPALREVRRLDQDDTDLLSLPILGSANCGPARSLATMDEPEGYLRISKSLIPRVSKPYILKAVGNSMNKARVRGDKVIEDGDFVLVDSEKSEPTSGDYVVSLIDGAANIKRFIRDKDNSRIVLRSDSTQDALPIYIGESDDYMIAGTVVDVIKH